MLPHATRRRKEEINEKMIIFAEEGRNRYKLGERNEMKKWRNVSSKSAQKKASSLEENVHREKEKREEMSKNGGENNQSIMKEIMKKKIIKENIENRKYEKWKCHSYVISK